MLPARKGNRRSHQRYTLLKNARYLLSNSNWIWKDCILIDISRSGMCLKINSDEIISVGAKICAEIVTKGVETVHLKGTVRWTAQSENALFCGIILDVLLDDTTLNFL